MAILQLIFRKMLNNRWLTGSLFLGLLITVSLVSSIPTYTSSVMQKMLLKELEDHQTSKNEFPGEFSFSDTFATSIVKQPGEALSRVESIKKDIVTEAGIPVLADVNIVGTTPLKAMYEEEARRAKSLKPGKLMMLTNIEKNVTLTDGKFPVAEPVDGVIEVLVSEQALLERDMVLGTTFILGDDDNQFIIKPVGAFQPAGNEGQYWSLVQNKFSDDFIVHEKWFRNELVANHEGLLGIGRFSTAFDYHKITDEDISRLLGLERKLKSSVSSVKKASILFHFPIKSILISFEHKGDQLSVMLWSLNVPVLIMLAVYLYMISRLIIERQLNEIAVFSSRGASRIQILAIYFIEIAILGLFAFFIGPFLGLLLCKVLGASNGFLEFVQRSALPIKLSAKSFFYAFLAVAVSIIMIMIPVYQASGRSIVNHKQDIARNIGGQKWYTVFIELALLGVSIYGLWTFNRRQKELLAFDGDPADLMIDPILFFIPALFIIGAGLFILRIYPWVLALIYKIGERFWSVSLYSTFLQVSRSSKQYQFLMLFLVMTIGMGVFSASAARTINLNLEEQLLYKNGAEVRVAVKWNSNKPASMPAYMSPSAPSGSGSEEEKTDELDLTEIEQVVYTEPPFDPFTQLEEVAKAAKVFKKNDITLTSNEKSIHYPKLLAIEPKSFGEVAWFKSSLLPHHWYQYLNLLAKEPSGILISANAAKSLGVKEGDYLSMSWGGSDTGEFVIYGIIDYWPAFNPLEKAEDSEQSGALVVANLPYVQNMIGLEPYEVWMKLHPEATRANFYESIKEKKIPVLAMNDVYPSIVELKNSALLLGLNGTMTLGFLISLMISFIGFILYWILTIRSRTLQYGIYRAMGIPMSKLIGILISEQLLTSGFACLLGITVGGITSQLFVPLFKLSLNVQNMMPPFSVVSNASDEIKIYIFVLLMLVLGSAILIGFLRKIKIHQAIKLGED